MDYLVLDTDVASRIQKGSLPRDFQDHLRGKTPCVTFVTVGEFFKGAFKAGWGQRKIETLEAWLRNVVVLPYTGEVSRAWGRVCARCQVQGYPIAPNDAWIAACCLSHDLPLMTLNRRPFERVEGLRLVPEGRD